MLALTKAVDQTRVDILVIGIQTGAVVVDPVGLECPFPVEFPVQAESRIQLEDFFVLATELTLDVLIETHDERELDVVLERIPQSRLIGINNRDLKTFSTDLGITERLAKRIPSDKLIVSDSGIHKRDDVVRIFEAGAHAMLIGESLLRAKSIKEKIRELLPTSTTSSKEPSGTRWV